MSSSSDPTPPPPEEAPAYQVYEIAIDDHEAWAHVGRASEAVDLVDDASRMLQSLANLRGSSREEFLDWCASQARAATEHLERTLLLLKPMMSDGEVIDASTDTYAQTEIERLLAQVNTLALSLSMWRAAARRWLGKSEETGSTDTELRSWLSQRLKLALRSGADAQAEVEQLAIARDTPTMECGGDPGCGQTRHVECYMCLTCEAHRYPYGHPPREQWLAGAKASVETEEDRSEPPPGYEVSEWACKHAGYFWEPRVDWSPGDRHDREEAVALCWAHFDSLTAPAEARALAAQDANRTLTARLEAAHEREEAAEARAREAEARLLVAVEKAQREAYHQGYAEGRDLASRNAGVAIEAARQAGREEGSAEGWTDGVDRGRAVERADVLVHLRWRAAQDDTPVNVREALEAEADEIEDGGHETHGGDTATPAPAPKSPPDGGHPSGWEAKLAADPPLYSPEGDIYDDDSGPEPTEVAPMDGTPEPGCPGCTSTNVLVEGPYEARCLDCGEDWAPALAKPAPEPPAAPLGAGPVLSEREQGRRAGIQEAADEARLYADGDDIDEDEAREVLRQLAFELDERAVACDVAAPSAPQAETGPGKWHTAESPEGKVLLALGSEVGQVERYHGVLLVRRRAAALAPAWVGMDIGEPHSPERKAWVDAMMSEPPRSKAATTSGDVSEHHHDWTSDGVAFEHTQFDEVSAKKGYAHRLAASPPQGERPPVHTLQAAAHVAGAIQALREVKRGRTPEDVERDYAVGPECFGGEDFPAAPADPVPAYVPNVGAMATWTETHTKRVEALLPNGMVRLRNDPNEYAVTKPASILRPTSDEPGEVE